MVEKFLEYLSFEKRYSKLTVQAYRIDLIQATDYLISTYDLELINVNKIHLRSWIVEMKNSGMSNRTIHRKISAVKSYFKFLLKIGEIENNPAARIVLPKLESRLPEFINKDELNELLQNTEPTIRDFSSIRNYLLLIVLYATGMRRAEIIGLKNDSVDLVGGKVKILGKRNKERIIPIGVRTIGLMNEYFELRTLRFDESNSCFFLSDSGEKLTEKFVYDVINKYLGSIPSLKKRSPHILRHTFATQLLDNGADLMSIKDLLGHESLSSTQVYTHNTIEKLKTIYKSAHPKEHKT
ncbi:MAG: tyrosine-type recombinase/integrase [Flavobacteriales bacterium]|nr:tyrosine-type recombinase/integrase [Flavobacteriales bacterium]MCB9197043.1 tyrosine-type recombinase/integrase [Flavobacteriales bacterium]